ncbi:MAG: PIN domain-containing protein, partial [Actinomycetia bacterium]|nr:PIN domain-containing protein [Actinomycetes bacterium]
MKIENIFIDTDIFLTYFVSKDRKKVEKCRRVFEQAVRGEIHIFSSIVVLAEVAETLEEQYGWKK